MVSINIVHHAILFGNIDILFITIAKDTHRNNHNAHVQRVPYV